ncbi:MAG: class I SAM-dependent methyltransferase [Patescibacteria group bacterium]|nr:class I SAM-dependent methyltransferase [Patescibacteria group bacterium]
MTHHVSISLIRGKEYWFNTAQNRWYKMKPPIRPSSADLKIYNQFLHNAVKGQKSPKVLILGATPELRDLAAKYTKEVTVVDVNLEMILAMTKLMRKKNPSEIWVKANWLSMPLAHNYYDVILGDGVVNNVAWSEVNIFWKHLAQILKPNGKFTTRILFYIPPKISSGIASEIMEHMWKRRGPNAADCAEMHIAAQVLSFDFKTKTTPNPSERQYNQIFQNHPWAKKNKTKIYKAIKKIYPASKKSWRALTPRETRREVSPFFKIIMQKSPPHSLFDKFFAVYYLQKK